MGMFEWWLVKRRGRGETAQFYSYIGFMIIIHLHKTVFGSLKEQLYSRLTICQSKNKH